MASNGWSTSLSDMSPADDCAMACCCPCIAMGKTGHRIHDPSMEGYSTWNNDCFMGFCLGNYWTCVKRGEIREKYGIEGSQGSDCCVSCWFPWCAIIQQEKEVKLRQSKTGGPVTTGYTGHKEQMQMGQMAPPSNGRSNGYSNGQMAPPTNGRSNGYSNGQMAPPTNGYSNGQMAPPTNGYSNGYGNGQSNGFSNARTHGPSNGQSNGF